MFFVSFQRDAEAPRMSISTSDIIDHLMPFSEPDKSGVYQDNRMTMVQCVTWNTAASRSEPAPYIDEVTGIHGVSWARIDNREEVADKLKLSRSDIDGMCDTELICRSYCRWKRDCIDHLIGDFVFLIYDDRKKKVFCGRDHMGVRPFYYYLSDACFVCATSLSPLIHIDAIPIHIRKKWIVDYLTHLSMSFNETPYKEILKLPPAHTLAVSPETHELVRYFELSAQPELKLKDSREYVEAYREQLETATKCRMNTAYPMGSELSGGIDSSTITAYAARFLKGPLTDLHAFAFANSEMEPQYILSVSQAYGLPHTHVTAGRYMDVEANKKRALSLLGYPVEHGNATAHEPFYQMASGFGIRTLLSGFGGDEFGTTIHGYMIPMEMILANRYKELMNILPGTFLMRCLRLAKLQYRQLKTHHFTRPAYNPRFLNAWSQLWPHQIVAKDAVQAYDLKWRYFETARFDAGYTDLKRFTLEKRWMPFVPTRMENCTLMAAARKIEYRWPLLDVRLVKCWLSIPSKENYSRGMGRYLHRRAVAGVIPDLVNWKKSKNMGNVIRSDSSERMVQGAKIDDVLHPVIKELVDLDKLNRQVEQAKHHTGEPGDNLTFQFRRNLHAVNGLNFWLKNCPVRDFEK